MTAGFTGRFSTFSKPDIASTVYITTKQKFELLCFLVYHKMVKIGTANFLPECICLSQRLDMTVEIAAWNKHSCIRVKKIRLRDGLFENTSKLCYPIPNNGCRVVEKIPTSFIKYLEKVTLCWPLDSRFP